jgi:hypothetical protein
MRNLSIITITLLFISFNSNATSLVGRLGIGTANTLPNNMPTLSLKLQRNASTALGGVFGLDSSPDGSLYALGIKAYRLIYDEPQLNFYSAFGATVFTYNDDANDVKQGNQIIGTFGSEFMFQGIESLGFSFEFGMGVQNYEGQTHIKTLGYNMIQSAIHFYL